MAHEAVNGEERLCGVMDVFFDDRYRILFEGLVYERVKIGVTQQEIEDYGYDYLLVVLSDERDEGYNVWGEGPEYVVFSGTLYHKSNDDPNTVDTRTVKTVNAMEPRGSDVEIEQPGIVMGEEVENAIFDGGFHRESSEDMIYAYEDFLQNVDPTPQNDYLHPTSSIRQPLPAGPSFDSHGFCTIAPRPASKAVAMPTHAGPIYFTMPPVAPSTKSTLQPFFDLPKHCQHRLTYTRPSRENQYTHPSKQLVPVATGSRVIKARHRMSPVEDKCFFELMELGMRILGRRLETRDFPAITEAFNRHCPPSGGAPFKGYNTLHSSATKNNARYEALVVRVLGNMPRI